MNKHDLIMIIGCLLPLLLIFVLPLFGVSGGFSLFIFIILMFACHIFMMGGHHSHGKGHNHEGTEHGTH
jgi:hypothetical protein